MTFDLRTLGPAASSSLSQDTVGKIEKEKERESEREREREERATEMSALQLRFIQKSMITIMEDGMMLALVSIHQSHSQKKSEPYPWQ